LLVRSVTLTAISNEHLPKKRNPFHSRILYGPRRGLSNGVWMERRAIACNRAGHVDRGVEDTLVKCIPRRTRHAENVLLRSSNIFPSCPTTNFVEDAPQPGGHCDHALCAVLAEPMTGLRLRLCKSRRKLVQGVSEIEGGILLMTPSGECLHCLIPMHLPNAISMVRACQHS